MFQKKCMVVGSLLVMAAQTATATSTCSGMTDLKATICGQNGYSGEYVDNPGDVNCAGDTCNNNDAITCCKPAALCTTITDVSDPFALSEVCSDNAVYAEAVTVGAFCAGTACALSDESGCCVVKANCDTITLGTSPSLTAVCGDDDAFTGTLIAGAKCAGATCALVDKETCCVQKALCGTITADSSPNLPTVCGSDPGYTGALGSSSAKCAGATCDATDRATCCAAATPADDDDDDDDDDNKFSNTCTAPKKQCEGSHEYLSGFKGGCQSCDDGPESCADLVSMIKKGGCYGDCAVGWSETTINTHSTEYKCEANELEKALGRKTAAELKKEMDAVGCGEKENYCGPAEDGGMTKDYIPEFKGGCSSCTESPADCKEAIDFVTTGCHASCAVGMTPEAVAELMKMFSCTEAETKTAQDAVALEQKAMLSAGESLLVNGLSLAALAAAAVFSAVC